MADTTAEYLEDLKRRTTRQAFMESVSEWKDADLLDVGVDAGVTSRKNFPLDSGGSVQRIHRCD